MGIRSYARECEIMEMGHRGCLVSFKTGGLQRAFTPVPYDSISWVSEDWYKPDTNNAKILPIQ